MYRSIVLAVSAVLFFGVTAYLAVGESPPSAGKKDDKQQAKWVSAVEPKPLSKNVERGLQWLAEHQLPDGAWGQGEESQHMGGGSALKDVPSVADTSMAALALLRSGSTPAQGPYAKNLLRAVTLVCSQIERSDPESLYITETRGTRVQGKLGPYIDTFSANLFLSEVAGQMPGKKLERRVSAALKKVLAKIQKNQRSNGTWNDQGWAPTLSQNLAVKGLNRAAQAGQPVDEQVLKRSQQYSRMQFDRRSGKFSAAGSAGVELYSAASNLGSISDSVNTGKQREKSLRQQLATAPSATKLAEAEAELSQLAETKEDLEAAQQSVVARMDDKDFMAGFGSNGGEEFLSYMNIGESLVVEGGEPWKAWDKSITENLNRVQNADGSWTGHHCITGRTFCTSAALLVLMVDRTPVPIAAKMGRR